MKEKKIARDTRNREKLAGDDWVMAEFFMQRGVLTASVCSL